MFYEVVRVSIGDGEPMLEALAGFEPLEVVVETCAFWPWIHDVLEPTEVGFHLAGATRLEGIAKGKTMELPPDGEHAISGKKRFHHAKDPSVAPEGVWASPPS